MGSAGEKNPSAKLSNGDVLKMRQSYVEGSTTRALADSYHVSISAVERLLSGRSWAHLTGGSNLLRQTRPSHTNTQRKLTWQQAQALRRFAPYTALTQRQWAALLGVDQRTISNVLSGALYQREEER